MKNADSNVFSTLTLGNALRHGLFNKITPILLSSDLVVDNGTRRLIQSSCLEMVDLVEQLIRDYGLDQSGHKRDQ